MTDAPPTDLLLLRREVQLERRIKVLRREAELSFYRPHPKQVGFHAHAYKRYRYARTGNRFGKSEMGSAEDVSFALGYRPWVPKDDPLRTLGIPPHPTKGVIITIDWDKSREVFTEREGDNLGKLFKYIPTSALGQPTKNHSGAIDRIPVKHISGGWSVIHLDTIKSWKQDPKAMESSVWDWAHIDEPCPEGLWKGIARGLVDRGGRGWFTCTPLEEPWIDEAFVPDLAADRNQATTFETKDRWMMTGSIYDNPYNTKENINSFLQWLTSDEIECRINGLPTSFAGLVYKEFNWDKHVRSDPPVGWPSWLTPPATFCKRFAIDYHPRKPHHVLFIATSPQDRHYVYAEVFRSCLMSELVANIKAVLGKSGATMPGLIDPLADTPNRVTDITPLEEVLQLGLGVMPATKDPYNGILRVKERLLEHDRQGNPMMIFNENLPRTMMEISRGYVWDGETNKPKKDKDDAMENLYRLCLQGLFYVEPTTDNDYIPTKTPDFFATESLNPFEFAGTDTPRSTKFNRTTRYRR